MRTRFLPWLDSVAAWCRTVFLTPAAAPSGEVTWPGRSLLGLLGQVADTRGEVALVWFLSVFLWLTAARIAWVRLGRLGGFYDMDLYHWWVAWLPWRPLARLWFRLGRWWETVFRFGTKATGAWTGFVEALTLLYRPGDIFLGRFMAFGLGWHQPIGIRGDRHLAMVAGSGSGKTTLLMTILAHYVGSAFVFCSGGQLTSALIQRCGAGGRGIRGKRGTAIALDPCRRVSGPARVHATATWNPLDEIAAAVARHGSPDIAVRFAMKIAEGLIRAHPRENPYWPESARAFLVSLILWVFLHEPPARRHLARVYDLVANGDTESVPSGKDAFQWLLFQMSESTAFDGAIASGANLIVQGGDRNAGLILATIRSQLAWLQIPEIRRNVRTSSFQLADLKTGTLTLFVCAAATDVQGQLAGWFRLLTVLALSVFETIPGRPKHPCLFALDEFANLGNVSAIETAAPLLRSYGVRLLAIVQDVERLKQAYPDAWGGFLGNAEAVWFMSTNHADTVRFLETTLGRCTRRKKIEGGWFSKTPARYQDEDRAVLDSEQIKRFLDRDRNNMIVVRNGRRPLRLKNAPYFTSVPVWYYAADPNFSESPLRRITHALAWLVLWPPRARATSARAHDPLSPLSPSAAPDGLVGDDGATTGHPSPVARPRPSPHHHSSDRHGEGPSLW